MRTIQKQELGMYNKSENTCLKAKMMIRHV